MKSLAKAVESFLQQEEIHYEPTETVGAFKSGFSNENGFFPSFIEASDAKRTIRVCTLVPLRVPRAKRVRVAELVARINEHLVLGHFELGMDSGVAAVETSILLGDSELHPDVMQHLLYANWWAMERYFPPVCRVVIGKATPKRALERAERKQRREIPDEPDTNGPVVSGRLRDILRGSTN
jgi:hypothetical protein